MPSASENSRPKAFALGDIRSPASAACSSAWSANDCRNSECGFVFAANRSASSCALVEPSFPATLAPSDRKNSFCGVSPVPRSLLATLTNDPGISLNPWLISSP